MQNARRVAALGAAVLLGSLLLIVSASMTAGLLREGELHVVEVSLLVVLLVTGGLAVWGATARRAGLLRSAALIFAFFWIGYSAFLLTLPRPSIGSELSSTIRQHAAIVVLVASVFLLAARALGTTWSIRMRRIIIAFIAIFGLVALGGFAWGAPGRDLPGTLLPLVLGGVGLAGLGWGIRGRRGSGLFIGAAFLLLGLLVGSAWHVLLDADKPVAVFSYAGPAGLALAPAVVLVLVRARALSSDEGSAPTGRVRA